MTKQSVIYLECPGCACAVRKFDVSPCPNCSCCVFCGSNLKADDPPCDCEPSKDPDFVNKHFQKLIIPEDQVARETRRMEIRKQLEYKKALGRVSVLMPTFVSVKIVSQNFDKLTWSWFGAYFILTPVVCLPYLLFVEWIFRRIEDHRLQLQDDLLDESRNTE